MVQGRGLSGYKPEIKIFIKYEERRNGFLRRILRGSVWEERIDCYDQADTNRPPFSKLVERLEAGEIGSFEIFRAETLPPPYTT